MAKRSGEIRRSKVSATLDPQLVNAVDRYVNEHPGLDRSKVLDEALALWFAREQQKAMEAQFSDRSGVDPDEWAAWVSIRDAAAERLLTKCDEQ